MEHKRLWYLFSVFVGVEVGTPLPTRPQRNCNPEILFFCQSYVCFARYFQKIGAQRCGKSGFKPGKEKFFYEGPLVKSEQIAAFLNGKLRTAVTSLRLGGRQPQQ